MYPVEPDGGGPRQWPRRRRWPWALIVVAALGVILAVPTLRTALTSAAGLPGGSAGTGNAAASTPAKGYAPTAGGTAKQQNPVQVAATGVAPTGTALPAGWTMTATGPLGPADREFLTKVRQAGLWEGPAGQMAQGRAADEHVKEVGKQLAADHIGLDQQVRQISAQLGVPLPDKPSDEQQGWLNELNGATGTDFDGIFANRLRAAHGKVFALVSSIRSGTRNDLVRTFAQTAVVVVMKHMTLLESIGNVDFNALPTPGLAAPNTTQSTAAGTWRPDAVWAVAGLALLVGGIAVFRIYRGPRGGRRSPAY
jgi:predicted outer membrane protein